MSNRHRARVTTVVNCSQAGKQDRPRVQGERADAAVLLDRVQGMKKPGARGLAGRAECSLSFRSSGAGMGVTASATTLTTRRPAIGSGQAIGAQKFSESRVRVLPPGNYQEYRTPTLAAVPNTPDRPRTSPST
jgi:hypothetical protein